MEGPTARSEGGFTYVGLLIAVAILGATLAATGEVWRTAAQRERERELLFVGGQFRDALMSYTSATPAGQPRYPRRLEDLVEDHRFPVMRRHLRRVYPDPMSGKADWGLVQAPGGGISGVHSTSQERPLKSAGFAGAARDFGKAERYSDWKFVVEPQGAELWRPRPR